MQINLSKVLCKLAYMKMSDRIKSRRLKRGMTQEELAKNVGVSRVSISQWERGDTSPKGENFYKLAKSLLASPEWLIDGSGSPDKYQFQNVTTGKIENQQIPVLSYVQAGSFAPCASKVDEGVYEYVHAATDVSSSTFAVWVKGNSMEPDFSDGDLIIIDPDITPLPGDFVIAKNGDEEATFKKYRPRGYKKDGSEIFELVPLNEDYPKLSSETCPITIIGKVIEHRKFFKRRR